MIHEFLNPIPVIVNEGGIFKEGIIWYVRDGGNFYNDIFCIILCDGGIVRHYRSDQFNVCKNATFGIYEKKDNKTSRRKRKV